MPPCKTHIVFFLLSFLFTSVFGQQTKTESEFNAYVNQRVNSSSLTDVSNSFYLLHTNDEQLKRFSKEIVIVRTLSKTEYIVRFKNLDVSRYFNEL